MTMLREGYQMMRWTRHFLQPDVLYNNVHFCSQATAFVFILAVHHHHHHTSSWLSYPFLSRVSTLTHDVNIAILSVRLSVCLSVRDVPRLDENGLT